jgi:hypothetical protein
MAAINLENVPSGHQIWFGIPWSDNFDDLVAKIMEKFEDTPASVILSTSAGKHITQSNFLVFRSEVWQVYPRYLTSGVLSPAIASAPASVGDSRLSPSILVSHTDLLCRISFSSRDGDCNFLVRHCGHEPPGSVL